ncbi:methylated-DNA--[protein]-cysteine S-methyltransferase [Pseudonocardia acaciae]|uniref:methylated-DNA--[protein]-cysteine S-methyltransferase n=1 Tax=Pseudonocardia acaciae TaxID=551276 RepID=UPI000684BF46|nr:methylated-DNA--[protein]-cysteine S-methyltransferase [Pseudonocardia acaciae]
MRFGWTTVAAPSSAPRPVDVLTVGVTEAGVALVCFGAGDGARRKVADAARWLEVDAERDDVFAAAAAEELSEYLAGRRRAFELPIDWRLTSGDQHAVLTTLYREVGYGETITYGKLATRSGAYHTDHLGHAARRVGSIMGSNPVPVIVPCHRVLASDGLGGFGGGLAAKRWLLELEGALPPALDLAWS